MKAQPIKCAVVLAAGFGSRLREADNCPKPLRPVASVPLLVRVLRGLAKSGIEHAAVVLGYQADEIRDALERQPGLGLSLSYVLNEQYAKSNGVSVLAAREFVASGCVLSMADHLYSPRVVSAVLVALAVTYARPAAATAAGGRSAPAMPGMPAGAVDSTRSIRETGRRILRGSKRAAHVRSPHARGFRRRA